MGIKFTNENKKKKINLNWNWKNQLIIKISKKNKKTKLE